MDYVLEIAKLLIPAGIVFLTTFFILKKYFEEEGKKRNEQLRADHRGTTIPMRIQAYERSILYLERISPINIVMRLHKPTQTAGMLQKELLETIRNEYDHNMAQQLYVSDAAWTMLKNAKEETIKIINMGAQQCQSTDKGVDLSQRIFEICSEIEQMPTDIAIKFIKKEAHKLF